MLDLIPDEIVRAIVDQLPYIQDRSRFFRVSKRLYTVILPVVYESITIRSNDESNLQQTDIEKFLRTANREHFTYVKDLRFTALIEKKDQFRCIHNQMFNELDDDDERDDGNAELVSRVNELDGLMPQTRPLFQSLPDNCLKTFSWHLGTCLPKELLGAGGYLSTRQTCIEDLSLITSDPCILPKEDWEYPISLVGFKSLKRFSWSGGLSREYFHALRDMLTIHASNLELLKLDLIDWWDAQWNWCAHEYDLQLWIKEHNFFSEKVLDIAPGETHVRFTSLKCLALSSVEFSWASLEIAHAFNVSNLRALSLRACPNTGSLLRKVLESGNHINIRSLELVISHHSDNSYEKEADEDWIGHFLDSFEGLTSLYLLVRNGPTITLTHRYWPSILHHKKTLQRLVYHELRNHQGRLDCNRGIGTQDITKLFSEIDLECVGMCLDPEIPDDQEILQLSLGNITSLKLLCVRHTGTNGDLELAYPSLDISAPAANESRFSAWGFRFFPNLLFIAFGDFSYGTQHASTQQIYRRYPFPGVDKQDDLPEIQAITPEDESCEDGFRKLHLNDYRFAEQLEQFRDALEACPVEPLYRKDF